MISLVVMKPNTLLYQQFIFLPNDIRIQSFFIRNNWASYQIGRGHPSTTSWRTTRKLWNKVQRGCKPCNGKPWAGYRAWISCMTRCPTRVRSACWIGRLYHALTHLHNTDAGTSRSVESASQCTSLFPPFFLSGKETYVLSSSRRATYDDICSRTLLQN
jgi:hypothetical protein